MSKDISDKLYTDWLYIWAAPGDMSKDISDKLYTDWLYIWAAPGDMR